jgi:hypothetical protein
MGHMERILQKEEVIKDTEFKPGEVVILQRKIGGSMIFGSESNANTALLILIRPYFATQIPIEILMICTT